MRSSRAVLFLIVLAVTIAGCTQAADNADGSAAEQVGDEIPLQSEATASSLPESTPTDGGSPVEAGDPGQLITEPVDVMTAELGFSEESAAAPETDERGLIDDGEPEAVEVEADQINLDVQESVLCATVEFSLDAYRDGMENADNEQLAMLATYKVSRVTDALGLAVGQAVAESDPSGDPGPGLAEAMAACESNGYER